MIMVEATDGIHAHAQLCQPRRNDGHEAHGLQGAVHVAGYHPALEVIVAQTVFFNGVEGGNESGAFALAKGHESVG